ncbi:hypothetical protein [Streptomyces sp. NPDC048385]|uniref:hypothetical protein n=1 Tax=unclassified Streptomyces TaxID=2593676 RepID=UPI00342619DE
MSASRERSGLGGIASVVGAGLLVVVCCAGPLLVAGGTLGAVGGALASPWLITVGGVVLLAGTGYALRCRARRRRAPGWRTAARPSQLSPSHTKKSVKSIRAATSAERKPPIGRGVPR